MQKVFVYGTLKRDEPNHFWLQDKKNGVGKYLNQGVTKTQYPLIIATKYNIPFLLHAPGVGYHVHGEVFEIDEKMLDSLDILEDHPNYYIREKDDILIPKQSHNISSPFDRNEENSESIQCWVYFLKNFKPELLKRQLYESYSSTGPHGLVYMDSKCSLHGLEEMEDLFIKKRK